MWLRNFVFVSICLAAVAAASRSLLSSPEPIGPQAFRPRQFQTAEFLDVVHAVNRQFQNEWQQADIQPAAQAPPLIICRRLSLALTGTVPSLEEIRAIEQRPDDQQIPWWLSRLLEDRRSSDYLAERLARTYVGTELGPFLVYRRRRFVSWLAGQLQENVPYDKIVRGLIADTGLWTDSPAVNFLTVTLEQNGDKQPDEIRLASRVSRAFLGVRLDCVQCHDDQLNDQWLQTDFHQLAAFFSEARQSLTGIHDQPRDYEYQYLDAETADVVPCRVPFEAELLPPHGPRRQRLARWVTHPDNRAFSRVTVNRVWALMFGVPLVEPIDDIPLEGPYPAGLETLSAEFVRSNYDLRHLICVIATTEVFQQDSRAQHELNPLHEAHWAAYPVTRLRPEQIAGGLLQAAALHTINARSHILVRLARGLREDEFVKRYGDTGEDEFAGHGGTIPQRLLMMNGQLVKEKTKENLIGNASTRIAV
ncbi:MAG: DUF1549 and DUF1553 domain-containing protein, partial [Planctomycetota bacterium]|nr:DUF1549 and DUF1553 domain-containing protein [Planctomycetota bacterium]